MTYSYSGPKINTAARLASEHLVPATTTAMSQILESVFYPIEFLLSLCGVVATIFLICISNRLREFHTNLRYVQCSAGWPVPNVPVSLQISPNSRMCTFSRVRHSTDHSPHLKAVQRLAVILRKC